MTAATTEARTEGRRQGIREAMTKCAEWFGTPDADDIAHILHGRIEALLDTNAPQVMHEDAPRAIIGEIGNQIHNLDLLDATAPAPAQPSVQEAARVLLDAANNGLELFDVDGPNELEGLAVKWSGNRGDGVIQLEIAEEFMRESLRALAGAN